MNANDDIQVLSITENDLNAKSSEAAFSLSSPNQNLSAFNNLDSPSQTSPNGVTAPENIPIAIVGMAMRLPGGISNEEELWDTLINKKDKRTLVPADRWNVDGFYSETPKRGSVKTKHGYFLDSEALRQFDASLFSITRAELEKLDPQHRLLLEVTRECLENAGEVNWRGKNIGCYVGVFGEDWLAMHAQDTQDSGLYRITGVGDFLLANRISYEYDFKGPSITVKTGCSAAMIGLHMACQAIKTGEISSAIVGGTNLLLTPSVTIAMTEQGVLSPDGSCKTFDAAADGYARGEAINTLYVKRLDEAIRDGNPIRAIVRSTATNCDGKTLGISYPSDESQENLIRRAYELAGLHDFCQTAVVECHGTGTAIGDRQETTAVGNVFGEKGVYITSVKPNLGHSEGASGLTSVMKSVLALERKTVLPNVKFQTPNPQSNLICSKLIVLQLLTPDIVPFKEMKLQVPVEATPWPENRDERVSVNSFGIGGANAHTILDSAESFGIKKSSVISPSTEQLRQRLVVFSANNADSVRKGTRNLLEYLEKHPESLNDVAYTTGVRREQHPCRSFSVSDGTSPLEFFAPSKIPTASPEINFVFTGQGAQWVTMGAKLVGDLPSVGKDFQKMDAILSKLPQPPSWTIAEELSKSKSDSRLNRAEFSQPLCTAVQIVIVNLLRSWGIFPSAVIGHSSGEFAAAYASGGLTTAEAIIGAYYRGLITTQQKRAGAMAAVGFGREDVSKYLVDGVAIACENSPDNTTISGDELKIDFVLESITKHNPKAFTRRVKVEMAYHSQHMLDLGEEYQALLEPHISSSAPNVPFYSTVLNEVVSQKGGLDASYWRKNLESPVLFNTTMENLLSKSSSSNLFLEIGPHSALAGPLRQIFKRLQPDAIYIPTLVRNENDTTSLLTTAGNLFLKGLPIDFSSINPRGSVLTTLPTYPWHHEESYWHESRLVKDWRLRKFPRHDLLGSQVAECTPLEPIWRNVLCLDDLPWIRDHVVSPNIVFPGTGYIAMAGEAIRQVTGIDDFTIRNFSLDTAMIIQESSTLEIMFTLRPCRLTMSLNSDWHEFAVFSYNNTSWSKHCAGQVRAGKALSRLESETRKVSSLPRKLQCARWYQAARKVGLYYGPAFQGLEDASIHPLHNIANARVSNRVGTHESTYQLHPTTLDFALQLFAVAAWNGQPRDYISIPFPTYFGEIYVRKPEIDLKIELSGEANDIGKGAIYGSCVGIVGGKVVLQFRDVKLSTIGS
ncbi:hypothetical protein BGAL_0036g00340 [Botrytis galanthina]|uniref:Carrier domain-containing protein n=1 Tax=Botrytis galanthina TaxID=278940 RepID=A0A4S8RC25_9HELO|nr:hypothetical protein BGAL_0036g00340 [Botrytis galanthina]